MARHKLTTHYAICHMHLNKYTTNCKNVCKYNPVFVLYCKFSMIICFGWQGMQGAMKYIYGVSSIFFHWSGTYIIEVGSHCFRYWLLVYKVPSHNQNQCQFIVRSLSINVSGIWIKIQKVCCENAFKMFVKCWSFCSSPNVSMNVAFFTVRDYMSL